VSYRLKQQGRTGIPLVDAGMRELWADRLHAQPSADGGGILLDQEHARGLGASVNSGSGTPSSMPTKRATRATGSGWQDRERDAAPYFRIFNPLLQAEKLTGMASTSVGTCRSWARMPPEPGSWTSRSPGDARAFAAYANW
jgi:deoxyribodipyrimidine photo-lyase